MSALLQGLLLAAVTASVASAEVIEKTGRFGGLDLIYKVVLPAGYDAAKGYPLVLVFSGGPQNQRMAESTIAADWQAEAERRGYVVVSPITPTGELFFEGADRIFPEFLDHLVATYKPAGGKMHVAGHSNGGLSAFHVAALHSRYFSTVTGYPGLLDGPGARRVGVLTPMCLFMHVGDRDSGWRTAMESQAEDLMKSGYKITMTVERDQVHRLRAQEIDLSRRLFEQIESCK